jgi:hypothetical protein
MCAMANVCLDPVRVFDDSLRAVAQRDITDTLRTLYRVAFGVTQSIAGAPHVRDLHPHLRRAQIETKLEVLAANHPGLSARIEKNRSGNSHVVIEAEHIILTESFARSPKKFVRWAAYRDADSLFNYPLFRGVDDADELQPGMRFNAILLHGPSPQKDDELGFAVIRFPRPGASGYLDEMINLLARFPEVIVVSDPNAQEVIPDSIDPKIRIDQPIRHDS